MHLSWNLRNPSSSSLEIMQSSGKQVISRLVARANQARIRLAEQVITQVVPRIALAAKAGTAMNRQARPISANKTKSAQRCLQRKRHSEHWLLAWAWRANGSARKPRRREHAVAPRATCQCVGRRGRLFRSLTTLIVALDAEALPAPRQPSHYATKRPEALQCQDLHRILHYAHESDTSNTNHLARRALRQRPSRHTALEQFIGDINVKLE